MLTLNELAYLFMEEQKIKVVCWKVPVYVGEFDHLPIKLGNFHVLHIETSDPYEILIELDG